MRASGFRPRLLRFVGAHQHRRGGAVGNARRAGRRERAVLLAERRLERRDLRDVGTCPGCSSVSTLDIALAAAHRDRERSRRRTRRTACAACARLTDSVANASCCFAGEVVFVRAQLRRTRPSPCRRTDWSGRPTPCGRPASTVAVADAGARLWIMCGALVIDSMPPATTTVAEPALIRSWPSMTAFMPEPQTLLIVVQPC